MNGIPLLFFFVVVLISGNGICQTFDSTDAAVRPVYPDTLTTNLSRDKNLGSSSTDTILADLKNDTDFEEEDAVQQTLPLPACRHVSRRPCG